MGRWGGASGRLCRWKGACRREQFRRWEVLVVKFGCAEHEDGRLPRRGIATYDYMRDVPSSFFLSISFPHVSFPESLTPYSDP